MTRLSTVFCVVLLAWSVIESSASQQQQRPTLLASARSSKQPPGDNTNDDSMPFRIMSIGPVQLWNSKSGFSWQARVDRSTALASARETTRQVSSQAPLTQLVRSSSNGNQLLSLSEHLFANYPVWLCRGWVSGGFLRAVPVENGAVDIRLFGLTMLRFGRPVGSRVSMIQRNTKTGGIGPVSTTQCVWSLPITGGIMSAADHSKNRAAGKLVFMLTTTTQQGATPIGTECALQTEIVDYRPLFVGAQPPANILRTGFYLSTQTWIHAYVMWRFHRRCRNVASLDGADQ